MLITHMQDCVSNEATVSTKLADLEAFYREAKQRFDEEADFANRARHSVVKLQSRDPDYIAVWEQFIEESLSHCQALYDKLHVTLTREDLAAESFYNDALPGIVSTLEKKGLLTESEGAHCVFLEQFKGKDGDPLPVIIRKKDGGYLYATTDLAAVDYRSHRLNADRSLYVVDARQSLHFQQVFAVAREAGFASDNISLEHIAYGTMMGSDGKPFKTRSGDTIKLVELLDEAVRRARTLVAEKSPDLSESEMDGIAEVVGIAAVKYADLSKNRTSDYVFDWSTMLSFEGNTAPYLLYAYARIQSVLRRASADLEALELGEEFSAEERALLIKNLQLPEAVHALANDCFPNQLCNFLYELAGNYMSFYEACPILKAEGKTQQSRLALCQLTACSLRDGLSLLGITPLNKM
jgi:arginyl-tRNA synthetase